MHKLLLSEVRYLEDFVDLNCFGHFQELIFIFDGLYLIIIDLLDLAEGQFESLSQGS